MSNFSFTFLKVIFLAIIIWILITLVPSIVLAQATISGNISGSTNGATVIVGSNIWLESGQSGQDVIHGNKGSQGIIVAKTRTDSRGNYIANVPTGTYIIIVWANGFTPESDTVNAPGNFSTVLLPTQRSSMHTSLSFGANIMIQTQTPAAPPAPPAPPALTGNIRGTPNATIILGNNIWFETGESGHDIVHANRGSRAVIVAKAKTAPNGNYTINVAAGNYVIIVWAVGFTPESNDVTVPGTFSTTLLPSERSSLHRSISFDSGISSQIATNNPPANKPNENNPSANEPNKANEPTTTSKPTGQVINLALGKPCKQSSIYYGTGIDQGANCAVDGKIEPDKDPYYMIHTNIEDNPWWQVDLGKVFSLTSIRLHNRINAGERAKFIQTFISQDGRTWEKVYAHNGSMWKTLNINVNDKQVRFVKVQLADRNYLHLFEVEVFGYKN
jgi:hypothetical protein